MKDRMVEDRTLSGVESTPKELTHGCSNHKDIKGKYIGERWDVKVGAQWGRE